MKKTFYVFKSDGTYVRLALNSNGRTDNTYRLRSPQEATQFASVREALAHLQRITAFYREECLQYSGTRKASTLGLSDMSVLSGSLQIVRVEETTTEGTKRRIEVPLGDPEQTGVAIKQHPSVNNYWTGNPRAGFRWTNLNDLGAAAMFADLSNAARDLLSKWDKDLAFTPIFVGIAEESTPGTTKYTETVLA